MLLSIGIWKIPGHAASSPRYASIVIDAHTGTILHQVQPDALTYPASLTKMMTLYLLFEALENRKITIHQKLKVSKQASIQPPTKLHLKPGDRISVKDAIFALMTHSANDVAVVVAEGLGKTEANFAQMMTQKARHLGMKKTTFYNAHGLPHKHQKTTARDMAILSQALYHHFPLYYRYFNTKHFSFRGRQYRNHNHLLGKVPGVDGIKTGFTCASGFNLAASAMRGGRRIIGVVLGGKSWQWRDKHMTELLNRVFKKILRDSGEETISHHYTQPIETPQATMQIAKGLSQIQTAHPRPRKRIKASASREWAIQIGAFSQVKSARQVASTARKKLKGLANTKIAISTSKHRKRKLYCAKLVGLTEDQAKNACSILHQRGEECISLKQ